MSLRLVVAIIWLAPAICRAAQWGVIPSDAATVSVADKLIFLEEICPGQATEFGCSACPKDTSFPGHGDWRLQTITYGHFRTATSDDALISGIGCEGHADGMAGAFLFTKRAASWQKLGYRAGEIAFDCKKLVASDGRDLLVCQNSDMHQGVGDSFLYLMDVGKSQSKPDARTGPTYEGPLDIFFGVDDSLGSCVKLADGTTVSGEIVSVTFRPPDGHFPVTVRVEAKTGKAAIPDKAFAHCFDEPRSAPIIRTVLASYSFEFDGMKIIPSKSNPPTNVGWAIAPATSYTTQ